MLTIRFSHLSGIKRPKFYLATFTPTLCQQVQR